VGKKPVSKGGKPKGFAWMKVNDPARLREICKQGGTKSQATGTAYRWDRAEATKQARAGGKARWRKKTGTEG
jgi:general stress protein YciG